MARVGFGRYAAYPIASAAGIFTNVVFGLMRGSILLALFAHRERIGAYDASATLTYVWLTQGLLNVVAMWGWQDLAIRVRTGAIATDLIRPIPPLRAALAADYGRAAYQLLVRAVPPILVGIVIFRTSLPPSPVAWLAFAVSLTLAIAVSLGFRFVYNVAAFWTTDTRGAMILALVVMSVFSGFTIPIQFFPPWLAAIANATPFPAMVQTPVDIFVGATRGPSVLVALAGQLAWAAGLLVVSYWLFAVGTRRLVVPGGRGPRPPRALP